MLIISIHQPEHLVWLGLLDKISQVDEIVLLDTVDFCKNYYQNRNKIRTSQGWQWVTVPVEKSNHKPINQINIIFDGKWQKKYLESVKHSYAKAPYFDEYFPILEGLITVICPDNLSELNEMLLRWFMDSLNIKTKISRASEMKIDSTLKSTDLLLEICKQKNARMYLSGPSGKDYLEVHKFIESNIEVDFHTFNHPVYTQQYSPFMPNMSTLDYLMNCGGVK